MKISPNANPPVCKIMNYGKYVYELTKKAKEAKKNQKVVEIKEIEEDYVAGCHKENYMKPHVCPVATGGWCKDYVKCRNLEGQK